MYDIIDNCSYFTTFEHKVPALSMTENADIF